MSREILVTADKGFAKHRAEKHCGILIVRLKKPDLQKIHNRVLAAFAEFPEKEWPGLLVTMRDTARAVWRLKDNSGKR